MIKLLLGCCLGMLHAAAADAASTRIAPGIDLIAGVFVPDQQPDGNSVVIRAPDGLIVIDTGRHVQHTQQIIAFAQQANLPIRAIINSHWHLDHIGGDARIRAAYPELQIYASDALEGALGGFLARYRTYLENEIRTSPGDPKIPAWRDELAIIDTAPSALPTALVTKPMQSTIAGRRLVLHLETHSVTAGDIWVFDLATHTLIAGDLVTLPVPFLDTACPERWKSALGHLEKADFKILIPGHGAPMHRQEFDRYRRAYGNLLQCAGSANSKEICAAAWVHDAGKLIEDQDRSYAMKLMASYVDSALRADSTRSAKLCGD
jgi:glyoxylase-like metal-dependent hydrolase (beta-lactamase superfamily II)